MRKGKFHELEAQYRKRAEELVSKMTLEEKVYQTLHSAPAVERLGIPAYNWWNEALHGVGRAGVATVFPQAIGLAAAFDEELLYEVADVISTEARAKFNMQQDFDDKDIYKGLTFWSPNVNIFRDPRWGRGHETYGEDPYLTSRLGVAFVEGLQGNDDTYLKVAACAKHFAVHSGPEGLRHSFNAECSKQDLYETYLPAFHACVTEAGAETVMGAYNRTNGEPCCGSKTLLKDILREDWGFTGHVTSDCWALRDFYEGHKVTEGPVDSVALAMNNGCDLNCGNLNGYLLKAVEEGLVSEDRITEAVVNLYTTRMKLGLFDEEEANPYSKIGYDQVDSAEHRQLNLKAAEKSLVLLKNDGILPLDRSKVKTIGIIGPNADSRMALVGNYEGTSSEYITVLEGIRKAAGEDIRIFYSEGCHLFRPSVQGLGAPQDRMAEVKGVCRESDVVVVCLGLDATLEGEQGDTGNEFASGDKPNLNFPGNQESILEAAYASGKPVILAVLAGSALAYTFAADHVNAILQCWYPGAQGGYAVGRTLFGDNNPQGKLPVTFYRSTEELPEFTDYGMEGRTYRYMKQEALYPFGFGLSYSNFEIFDVQYNNDGLITGDDSLTITARVKNTGNYDGIQTIETYVRYHAPESMEHVPNCQLKALAKVGLKAGEEKKVTITLTPESFGLYDEDGRLILHAGEYSVFVGFSQPDGRSISLMGQSPAELSVTCKAEKVL